LSLFPFPHAARRATRGALAAAALAALAAALPGCSRHAPPPAAPAPAAPPADVPQGMAGVWTSTRGMVMRCIELHADGTYMMLPNAEAGDHLNYQGTWRVADGRITWRDSSQGFAPDVNTMESVSTGHFSTIEADNSRSQFDRIAGPGEKCPTEVSK
jgi:hypothetical protein